MAVKLLPILIVLIVTLTKNNSKHPLVSVLGVTSPTTYDLPGGQWCYSCHMSPHKNECTSALDILQHASNAVKEVFQKGGSVKEATFAANYVILCPEDMPYCVLEEIVISGELKLYNRGCSDGRTFAIRLDGTRLQNPKPDNITHCTLVTNAVGEYCMTLCNNSDFCNGPNFNDDDDHESLTGPETVSTESSLSSETQLSNINVTTEIIKTTTEIAEPPEEEIYEPWCFMCYDLNSNYTMCGDAAGLDKSRDSALELAEQGQKRPSLYGVQRCGSYYKYCAIQEIFYGEKNQSSTFTRDCSDRQNFPPLNLTNTPLEIIPANNITRCYFDERLRAQVCLTLCQGHFCNGPQIFIPDLQTSASSSIPYLALWYHVLLTFFLT